MKTKFRMHGNPSRDESPLEKDNRLLARQAAMEGFVLLKNEGVLPLEGKRIALFGIGARETSASGEGSGEVHERYDVSIEEGLKANGFVLVSTSWLDRYEAALRVAREAWKKEVERKIRWYGPIRTMAMFAKIHSIPFVYPEALKVEEDDLADADAALYVLNRRAGEGADRSLRKGDWQLTDAEVENIRALSQHYRRFVLVINAGGFVDLSPLDAIPGIGAVFFYSEAGEEGGNALAEILSGAVSPSGHLTQTWARHYEDYPSASLFGSLDGNPLQTDYKEGILVGYRHFEAQGVSPRFPFGYGLSYTSFSQKLESLCSEKGIVRLSVLVRNEGEKYAGKAVSQLYLLKPQGGLIKERKSLAAFAKSSLLQPQESQGLNLSFDLRDLSSFDETRHAYVLGKGDYGLFLGTSSSEGAVVGYLHLPADILVKKVSPICPRLAGFEEELPAEVSEGRNSFAGLPFLEISPETILTEEAAGEGRIEEKETAETSRILSRLSPDDLTPLVVGNGYSAPSYNLPRGTGRTTLKLLQKGLPDFNFVDGPSGVNLMPKLGFTARGKTRYVDELPSDWQWGWIRHVGPIALLKKGQGYPRFFYATAFPVPSLQAQSWNLPLLEKIGEAVGAELSLFGQSVWLAPGMNLQRNPLCGRNFEYYSEDPLLSGLSAAAITRGVQARGEVGVALKHFCCNNQEEERTEMSANLSERALREIYLRSFEIAIRLSSPWSIMTSYNKVNGVYCATSYDLCTRFLRLENHFSGFLMTDWYATANHPENHAKALAAGVDILMPGNPKTLRYIKKALKQGSLSQETIRLSAIRILNVLLRSGVYRQFLEDQR
jgi:beta-glucosidase